MITKSSSPEEDEKEANNSEELSTMTISSNVTSYPVIQPIPWIRPNGWNTDLLYDNLTPPEVVDEESKFRVTCYERYLEDFK